MLCSRRRYGARRTMPNAPMAPTACPQFQITCVNYRVIFAARRAFDPVTRCRNRGLTFTGAGTLTRFPVTRRTLRKTSPARFTAETLGTDAVTSGNAIAARGLNPRGRADTRN